MGVNRVQIDPAQLHADTDRVISDIPPEFAKQAEPVQPGQEGATAELMPKAELTFEQIEEIARKHYAPAAHMVVSKCADYLVPNWRLSHTERTGIGDAVALTAAAWFPDLVFPPRWAACILLATSVFNLLDSRRDPETGELPPRTRPQPPKAADANAAPAPPQAA